LMCFLRHLASLLYDVTVTNILYLCFHYCVIN